MGLREKKAARTRERIRHEAVKLFSRRGYEATTVEQIAEAAEVGTSTLYRFYPTKDSILLRHMPNLLLAPTLRKRFATHPDEELGLALGHAIYDTAASGWNREVLVIRDILDRSPGPRARLWDTVEEERTQLAEVIAERVGKAPSDTWVVFTAWAALLVWSMAADAWRANPDALSPGKVAEQIISQLAGNDVVIPRL
ncbi:MAG: TetR/AcrR family transcriptional regulator [Bifidobacteriaceae bacterium]|jgi:AcrR family transcriptional regulator|nr:TetR/AcrR family transcriptional regulator [Bifidobacteriaceae bacterium]